MKENAKMIFRYLKFLIWNDIILHAIALFIYPALYVLRAQIRAYKSNKIIHALWGFLNDEGEYGDKFFYEKEYRGDGYFKKLILSWKWAAWRNPMRNLYFSKNITGMQVVFSDTNITCHRGGVSRGLWRTTKYKNSDDVFKDKHGDYIDYDQSILGKQWYVFSMNNVLYFRKSMATVWYCKFINKLINIEYKFGFENTNYATQFHIKFLKSNEKSLREFRKVFGTALILLAMSCSPKMHDKLHSKDEPILLEQQKQCDHIFECYYFVTTPDGTTKSAEYCVLCGKDTLIVK